MNKLKINVKLLMNDKRCEPENDGRCLQRPHFLNLIKFHKFDLDKGGGDVLPFYTSNFKNKTISKNLNSLMT